MIRVYLDNSYIEGNQVLTALSVEVEALALDIKTMSYIYDTSSNNVMVIVEGVDADKLNTYMFPPNNLNTLIINLPEDDRDGVINELGGRGIVTEGSETCGDLLNNICKFFNADFKSLGSIMEKDFS